MGLLGSTKNVLNRLLAPFGVRLESLTAQQAESRRLAGLVGAGHFERPVFPVPAQFLACDPTRLLAAVRQHEVRLARFASGGDAGQYTYGNPYFTSPDAEVLYAMVQLHRPRQIVEIGSGYSTQLFRAAIEDAGLDTRLTSIDPAPRREIERDAHEIIRRKIEESDFAAFHRTLRPNDFLFIDSSHEQKAGNDVLLLLLNILPFLTPGVIVHLHDIFLPYEYPKAWIVEQRWNWTEQYLVQALLQGSSEFEVLWAGHDLQRTHAGFERHFPNSRGAAACSLWLRRAATA
jgi:predicted O-methyltransferase YrrM